ncbi:MAG TPA: HlyD family efflux transporter periplasmic adaptor subunit [Rhizomicrobium sp.]|nr:HlyD family efflux transporter periplasmic adaptor subunit [Rhizomicrobium sp.]
MTGQPHPALTHPQGATSSAKPADFRKVNSSAKPFPLGISKRILHIVLLAILVAAVFVAWILFSTPALPPGFAAGNGRLEAKEIYTATKYAGRVKTILFNEGDTVEAGQVVARMDTSALDAQLRQEQAQIIESENSRKVALAQIAVKQANYNYAQSQYQRSKQLVASGAVSGQEAEIDNARMLATRAELVGSQAEAVRATSAIDAAKATADRISAEINDATLVSPIRARIQTRISEPGEVLGAGGRVFSLADLSDVYMYVFLPESVTGKVKLGSEARIVLDAAPQYPIRAIVSYVSPTAQFTPKTVETAEERHNLTFRVKLQLDKNRLRAYEPFVKSGLPGMGYVRYDDNVQWPENLRVKAVDPRTLWNATGSGRAN